MVNQQFTRCPECKNVAKTPSGHRVTCSKSSFVSTKIGAYELPMMEFQKIRFEFQNIDNISCEEKTHIGAENFLITKFFTIGSNIRIRRVYSLPNITIDVKIKPSVSFGFGRSNGTRHMASIMFCADQVRINHFYHIDEEGKVSFSLTSKTRLDENHDVELKLDTMAKSIFFTMVWNDKWKANCAMSENVFTIAPIRP